MRARSFAQVATVFLAALAVALFVFQCLSVGDVSIDDAFFTFSYAKNLAARHGPVYSHSVRVEGCSAFLWMVLVALPLFVVPGLWPLTAARLVGAPFVLLLGWSTFRLARLSGGSRLAGWAAVFLLTFDTDLAVAYVTGMETLPFVALVTFALALACDEVRRDEYLAKVAWAALAVALMRIDGALIAAMVVLWALGRGVLHARTQRLRPGFGLLHPLLPAAALYGVWFVWRWRFYGLPLPSTYYAKNLIAKLLPHRGLEYVSTEVLAHGLWAAGLGAGVLFWRRRRPAVFLCAVCAAHLGYVISVGGDWMPFGRFVLPVVPAMAALLSTGLEAAVDLAPARGPWRPSAWSLATALLVVVAAVRDHLALNNVMESEKTSGVAIQRDNVESYVRAAVFLRQVVPPGGRLVSDYGGVFSCATDAAIIEMWGLANAAIATRGTTDGVQPIYGKTCPSCYAELAPEFFHVMAPLVRQEPAFGAAAEVIAQVWQHETIGPHVDLEHQFVVGRVVDPRSSEALYFLQKRDPRFSQQRRVTDDGFVVEFPFEGRP